VLPILFDMGGSLAIEVYFLEMHTVIAYDIRNLLGLIRGIHLIGERRDLQGILRPVQDRLTVMKDAIREIRALGRIRIDRLERNFPDTCKGRFCFLSISNSKGKDATKGAKIEFVA
jgi:hypothetical protein